SHNPKLFAFQAVSGALTASRDGRPAGLSVEPDVFHAPAVEDAVGRDRQPFDIGLPTGCAAPVDDRPGAVLGQFPLDLPDQLLALLGIDFGRLSVDQLVEL